MLWLLAGPFLLLLLAVSAFLPYPALRTAVTNVRRPDGTRSSHRTRREARHLATFLRSAVLVPLAVLVSLQGGAFVIHNYVVPNDTTLSALFGENHPDVTLHAPALEIWDGEIQTSRLSDALAAEGYNDVLDTAPDEHTFGFLGGLLVDHWPLHLIFLFLPLAYLAVFFRKPFFTAVRTYHAGVARRAKRYALHSAVTRERSATSRSTVGLAALRPHRQEY